MVTFSEIVKACSEEEIALAEVDRILVLPESRAALTGELESRDMEVSQYKTIEGPAIRETDGEELMVYTDPSGREQTVSLE